MSDQQAFETLKEFFEERPVSQRAADPLREGVEISIIINDNFECAFFKKDGRPRFEARPAQKPDVTFYIQPEAVNSLVSEKSDDIADFGVNIVKNYMAGNVRIKVTGSMINLLTNGYLGIIKSGGASFLKFLAQHGVSGLNKLREVFQKLRKG